MELRRLLFHRDFQQLSGGHLKVWDYFQHAIRSKCYVSEIYFTPMSVWNPSNPWFGQAVRIKEDWKPLEADALFLAGLDWLVIPEELRADPPVPVINLIQGTRHSDPLDVRYSFLRYRAVRICVSQGVEAALQGTGQVNGPMYTIPNCLDLSDLPAPLPVNARKWDVFIGALKAPELGQQIFGELQDLGLAVHFATELMPRDLYLKQINDSRVALLLPNATEGFYLPALEAMALDTVLVCPDCVGNRSFCIDGHNCLRPEYTLDALTKATNVAISLSDSEWARWIANGRNTIVEHSISKERASFLTVLNNLDSIWTSWVAK
jgi:hypothetical protein